MVADKLNRNGHAVRQLARQFGVDESTLRRRLKRHREGTPDGRKKKSEIAAPFHAAIQAWMETQDAALQAGRRPAPVKELFLALQAEGYRGSYKAVLRYVRRRAKAPAVRPVRRVEVKPGSQMQSDWGHIRIRLGNARVRLYALVVVLGFSRMWYVFWSRGTKLEDWIEGHLRAFAFLGGIPWTLRHDNLKTAVAGYRKGKARIGQAWKLFARQMGFRPDPIRPRTPRHQGKVERRVRDTKMLGDVIRRPHADLAALQRARERCIWKLAARRAHPWLGMSILEAWQREKAHLLPLPPTLPEVFDVQVRRKVSREGLVSFEGRRYQVSPALVGHHLHVRGCRDEVHILTEEGVVVARYPRGTRSRLLLDQGVFDAWPGDERVQRAAPLGKVAREIVMERTWTAPVGDMERYGALVGRLS